MIILGIETSADETAAAVIEDGRKIISTVVASSMDLHDKTGGIIPEAAAREQVRYIIPVINESLHTAFPREFSLSPIKLITKNIDALAITIGPGLNGSLLVGIETAKTIAYLTGKPIIPVNHIFAHLYANWLNSHSDPQFPILALVVSGGHTELFILKSHNDIKWLGGTRDDAAGEAFDKTARLLGLGYPGGPTIAKAASTYQPTTHNLQSTTKLPRPMLHSDDFDFSFSGLKTAVFREVNNLKSTHQLNDYTIGMIAYELQESITDVLVKKTLHAAKTYHVKSILLGGGVSANKRLTEKFILQMTNDQSLMTLHVPPPALCTDNAAYIASYAYFHNDPIPWQAIQSQPDLTVEV